MTKDGRAVGFNDVVIVEGRELQVQTEVIGTLSLNVQTTIMDAGTVRHVTTQQYPVDLRNLELVKEVVERQHTGVMARVARREIV